MAITYVPVLPTVLIDANVLPARMAQGLNALAPAIAAPAMHWSEDAPTQLYTPLPPPPPDENRPIPATLGQELIAGGGVTLRELTQLETWMDSRGLRASLYTSAVTYLARMRSEASAASEPAPYYIGCGLSDDLTLGDPYVRPRHLSVLPDTKGRYWIRNRLLHTDAYVTRAGGDPEPMPHETRLQLQPGDVITVGNVHLEFRLNGRKASFVRTRPPLAFDPEGVTRVDFRIPS
ncbi:MAG TPA: FHA domain-containing protein [bacterium]|nr:FHA domain-containing protein [bacterium]